MAHSQLYLRDPKAKNATTINLFVSTQGNRIKISTGQRIHPKSWNAEKQLVKHTYRGSVEINHALKSFEEQVQQIVRTAEAGYVRITRDYLLQEIAKLTQEETGEEPGVSFWDSTHHFIESSRTAKGIGTVKNYLSTLKHLRTYEKRKRIKLRYDTFDVPFYDDFLFYLLHVAQPQMFNNTAGKHIKTLKVFLNYAFKQGYHQNLAFKTYKVLKEEATHLYLSHEEIQQLEQLDLSAKPYLQNARDFFFLGLYTGMRYSNYEKIQPGSVQGDFLITKDEKEGHELRVPILPQTRILLDKLFRGEIHVITNQQLNSSLKEIAQEAGWDEPIEVVKMQGAKSIRSYVPKWSLLQSHDGRRAFITKCLRDGIPAEVVKEITGHKDDRSFRKYVDIADDTAKDYLLAKWK